MSKFKVGDRVVRTRHHGQNPSGGWPDFQECRPYLVTNVSLAGWLGIAELNKHPIAYDPDCFELYVESAYVPEIGDYVEVTEDRYYVSRGAKGKVVQLANDQTTRVLFTSGDYDVNVNRLIGGLWINTGVLKLAEPAYSASFTAAAKSTAKVGHTSDGGGLQQHSLGNSYPWAIVAYADKCWPIQYTIENLESGVILMGDYTSPRSWALVSMANDYLKRFMQGTAVSEYRQGRPVFNEWGNLSFDTDEQPITVYYRALEQDIG